MQKKKNQQILTDKKENQSKGTNLQMREAGNRGQGHLEM